MATPRAFVNATGVDFSPPSPVDNFSPSSRRLTTNKYNEASSIYAPSQMSSGKEPKSNNANSQSRTFDIPPPTAPRSMRQNISPPPLRRADTYRTSSGSGVGGFSRAEDFRRAPRRYSDEHTKDVRAPFLGDSYRPSSPRRRDASRERARRMSPARNDRYEDSEPIRDPRLRRRGNLATAGQRLGEEAGAKETAGAARRDNTCQKPNEDTAPRGWEAANLVASKINDKIRNSSLSQASKNGPDTEARQKRREEPPARMTFNIPSHHHAYAVEREKAASTVSPVAMDRAPNSEKEDCIESIEKDPPNEPLAEDGSFLRPRPLDMTRSRSSREEIASTPSTGTAGSRQKNTCRACRKPGSTVTQLVPCKLCPKGYHDCCGNPKPSQSERLDDFVCGRCLRKQEAAQLNGDSGRSSLDHYSPPESLTARKPVLTIGSHAQDPLTEQRQPSTDTATIAKVGSGRSSIDRYSPTDTLTLDLPPLPMQPHIEAPVINPSPSEENSAPFVKPANPQPPSSIAATKTVHTHSREADKVPIVPIVAVDTTAKPPTTSSAPTAGARYKNITCPSWSYGDCKLIEAHCIFAHRNAGCDAPRGGTGQAKDFTCPNWTERSCRFQEWECQYAHIDTGLYIGIDGKASLKHITCWYWKFAGHCRLGNATCLYAHTETGTLAWQPIKESQSHIGPRSLKDFMCPRFEIGGRCSFQPKGTCPYTHAWSAKSCYENYCMEQVVYSRNIDPRAKAISSSRYTTGQSGPSIDPKETAEPTKLPSTETQVAPTEAPGAITEVDAAVATQRPPNLVNSIAAIQTDAASQQEREAVAAETPGIGQATKSMTTPSHDEPEAVEHNAEQPEAEPKNLLSGSKATTERSAIRTGRGAARRGGLKFRPSLGRVKATSLASEGTLQDDHQSPSVVKASLINVVGDPESTTSSNSRVVAETTGSIERKKCEGCPKTIFSSGSLCHNCLTKQQGPEVRGNKSDTVATNGLFDPSETLQAELTDDLPDTLQDEAQNAGLCSVTSDVSYQSSGGAVARKRPAQHDHLFIPNKRSRNSQTPREAAVSALRQGRRADTGSGSFVLEKTMTLEETIEAAIKEKRASERASTERASSPHASRENGSKNLSDTGDGQEASRTTTDTLSASSPDQEPELKLAASTQPLGKRARCSSSGGSVPESSIRFKTPEATEIANEAETDSSNIQEAEHPPHGAPSVEGNGCSITVIDSAGYQNNESEASGQAKADAPRQRKSRIFARKVAPAPGVQIRKKSLIREDDESDVEQNAEDDEHEVALARAAQGQQTTLGVSPETLPATPGSTKVNVNDSHLTPTQPYASPIQPSSTSSTAQVRVRPQGTPRCPRCRSNHRRCWHKTDGSADPTKCEAFLQHFNNERPHWCRPSEWKKVLEGARRAVLNRFIDTNYKDISTSRNEITGNDANGLHNEGLEPQSDVSSQLTEDEQGGEDGEDEVRPIRFASSSSSHVPRSLASTASNHTTKKTKHVLGVALNALFDVTEGSRPSYSPLTTVAGSSRPSRTVTEGAWTRCSQEEINSLKARGIMVESDSEGEEEDEDDFQPPPAARVDPLWGRPDQSNNLFEIDPSLDMTDPASRLAATGMLPSRRRPSKKALSGGKLLVYQCAERKKRFGNAHQEVRRYPEEVLVTTQLQRGIDFDARKGPQAETETVTMTFREFLGAPKDPVIDKRRDQLVFREKETMQQVANRNGRARRGMDSDVFPFL